MATGKNSKTPHARKLDASQVAKRGSHTSAAATASRQRPSSSRSGSARSAAGSTRLPASAERAGTRQQAGRSSSAQRTTRGSASSPAARSYSTGTRVPQARSAATQAQRQASPHARANASRRSQKGGHSAHHARQPQRAGGNFYTRHLAVMVPLTVLAVLLVGACVFDVAGNWGTVHAGVTVEGIDVGGLTAAEASQKIADELQQRADAASIVVYEGSPADAATEADGASGEGGSDGLQQADAATTEEDSTQQGESDESSPGSDTNDDGIVGQWELDAESLDVGVAADEAAQEAYAVGRTGNVIAARVRAWVTGTDVSARITYDADAFASFVDEVNDAIGEEVVNSKASIEDGVAELSEGSDGWLVDEDELVERLSAAFFEEDVSWLVTPMHTVAMYIQPETAQNIVDQINAVIAEAVEVCYEDDSWTMHAKQLGNVIGQKVLAPGEYLQVGDGKVEVVEGDTSEAAYDMSTGADASSGYVLQAYVNQKKLDEYLVNKLGDKADGDAQDAYFDTSSGEVVIVESVTGEGPDRAAAELAMQELLFGSDEGAERVITIEDTVIEPDLTTEEAEAMGITEKLASWSIAMSGSSNRQHNIKLLCSLIDGSLTAPGESWSFNETTGERTEEKGFKTAPVIVNGTHEDQLGGGICQVATCVFNAACYSGLGIGTRANHTYYISAYDDEGFADATVSWTTPDLEWINDTDNYILLTASAVEGGYVTVSLWGTSDGRTVTCDRGEWEEGEEYETVYEDDDTLAEGVEELVQSGVNGRSIYIRYLVESADGEVLHDINFHSVYAAEDEIIAVGTKKSKSSSSSSSSSSSGSDDEDEDDEDDGADADDSGGDDASSSGDEEETADESSEETSG